MADTKLVKSAGEHWVCGVLSRLGWAAALTRDGIARTDVLAVNSASGEMIEVQVKTASFSSRVSFMLGEKGCDPSRSDHEWYVLVALAREAWEQPRAFVVPNMDPTHGMADQPNGTSRDAERRHQSRSDRRLGVCAIRTAMGPAQRIGR